MTRAAIYIRKSREEKDKPSQRLTVQREALPAHASAQGWTTTIYDDGHASAAKGKTEDLQERARLEADIRAHKINLILCIELSRLSRDETMQDYVAWLHLCSSHGVKLATLSRVLDPAQPSDWMLLLMEGGFSSVEMKMLSKRMKEGRDEAAGKGLWLGGKPPPPYIYDAGQRKPIIDPAALLAMQQIWSMSETISAAAIAAKTGRPEIAIRRMISDDRLLLCQSKRRLQGGSIIDCTWQPCLTADQAGRIQRGRRTRRQNGTRREAGGLLSALGILRCGYCGHTAKTWQNSRIHKDGSRLDYYGCRVKSTATACPRSRMIPQPILDERVVQNILNTLAHCDELRLAWESTHSHGARLEEISRQLGELQRKKNNLIDAITNGVISHTDARAKLAGLTTSQNELTTEHAHLIASITPPDWDALQISGNDYHTLETSEQRDLIRLLINEIRIYGTYALIDYTIPRDLTGNSTARIHLPPSTSPKKAAFKTTP